MEEPLQAVLTENVEDGLPDGTLLLDNSLRRTGGVSRNGRTNGLTGLQVGEKDEISFERQELEGTRGKREVIR